MMNIKGTQVAYKDKKVLSEKKFVKRSEKPVFPKTGWTTQDD